MGWKNILFIGSFTDPEQDVHNTYYGKLHGPVIILNLLYSLVTGQNTISFGYAIWLWLGMGSIFYILLRFALHLPLFKAALRHPITRLKVTGTRGKEQVKKNIFRTLSGGLVEVLILHQLHLWVFLLFVITTALLWGKILNGFMLLLLAEFIYMILHYFADQEKHH